MTKRKLGDFRPQAQNANKHTERGLKMLDDAIAQDGYVAPMTAAANGDIIDGSARRVRVEAVMGDVEPIVIEHDGTRPIVAIRTDIPSADTPEAKRIALRANRIAQADLDWDADVLAELLATEPDVLAGLWERDELAALLADAAEPEAAGAEAWDKNDTANPDGDGISERVGYNLGSIWYDLPADNEIRRHMLELPQRQDVHDGATVKLKYSRTNATETERIVKTYMRPGDRFFEMCCGWMTFSSTAKYLGFSGRGGDIWDVSLDFCKRQIEEMPGAGSVDVVRADCRATGEQSAAYDFVHSNPPFFSLEPYGETSDDLASQGSYERWLDAMADMGAEAARILKPGGLANFVINDWREGGVLRPMHADFIEAIGRKSGLVLHDLVVAEVVSQALRFRKHDYERRRTVKCHEYVITFRAPAREPAP